MMQSPKSQSLTVGLKQGKSHLFFSHYLYLQSYTSHLSIIDLKRFVRLHLVDTTLTKSCIYAIYRHMMPEEYKYDYANFSNALYDWVYIEVFKVPRVILSYAPYLLIAFSNPMQQRL